MNNRPTIGFALSGGSSRAIAHIAVLEVMKENDIPIDYLTGCSSGALVAVSFASGRMEYFKNWMHEHTLKSLIRMWTINFDRGALFDLGKGELHLKEIIGDISFETAHPKLGFVAADVNSGELVTISMGDLFTAVRASFAVPGLFPPVIWGNKILVDGGLVNIVPTLPAKEMGADIVIGVNVSGAKFIYEKKLPYWRAYRYITKILGIDYLTQAQTNLLHKLFSAVNSKEYDDTAIESPGIIRLLARALDRSMEVSDKWTDEHMACDLMITPEVKQYRKTEMGNLESIYQEGRRAALAAVPQIKSLLAQHGSQSAPIKNKLKLHEFKR